MCHPIMRSSFLCRRVLLAVKNGENNFCTSKKNLVIVQVQLEETMTPTFQEAGNRIKYKGKNNYSFTFKDSWVFFWQ